jgi:3-hydroxy-D-aspartate aldolase
VARVGGAAPGSRGLRSTVRSADTPPARRAPEATMTTRPPAEIGMTLAEVDTPALLLELDALERNLARMAEAVAGTALRLRPHAKTHKCPVIALRQMAHGAVGVCCQKVGEAEAMVLGGVPDVYVSNEIVGAPKLARLAALARQARVATCVDDPAQVAALSAAAQAFGAELRVLVEIDVGAGRCGIAPGEPAARLAAQVAGSAGLRFGGLQAYHGSSQHLRTHAERREAIQSAVARVRETQEALRRAGLACETVSGAGTGTFALERDSGVYDELQVGSYAFMDADYARNLDADGAPVHAFEHSLFVYATVMSRPGAQRALLDAGLKALAVDSGMPTVAGRPDLTFERASDEHGRLLLGDPARAPALGEKLRLIPGHCDPTVNLYDWYVCLRDGRVEALWPITARGAVL